MKDNNKKGNNNKQNKKSLLAISIASAMTLSTTVSMSQATEAEANVELDAPQFTFQKLEEKRYIIKFRGDDSAASFSDDDYSPQVAEERRISNLAHLESAHGINSLFYLNRANAAVAILTDAQLQALGNDDNVEYVEVDPKRHIIQSVTRVFEGINQTVVSPSAETNPYGINLVQANQVSDANTGNIKVCITDSGYEGNHEDLRAYTDYRITGNNSDGQGNNTGSWWEPGNAHGTHVAGTIGAIGNNGKGVNSINPSGLLKIHNVKVFGNDGNWGYGSDMVKAVEQCRNAGAKIINMSLGGSQSSMTERNAFNAAYNAGVLNIAAAGNAGNSSMSYPASYDSVMSVAAVNSSKSRASFSQYNSQVEIAAPGVSVTSTVLDNGYATWDGTSMATPHVAGVAALVWSHYPSCSASQIRNAINVTAEDLGSSGRDSSYGYGLIKARAMYNALSTYGCNVIDDGDDDDDDVGSVKLTNGVAKTIQGSSGQELRFTMDVPSDAGSIKFEMSGGTGDADLYVKYGSAPSTSSYDCRPYAVGNNESCSGTSAGGTYHVMVRGYSSFSGVSLKGSYMSGPIDPPVGGDSFTNNNNVNIWDNQTSTSTINVTDSGDSGSLSVSVDIKHTYVGDLKLTIEAPNGASAVLREYQGGSADDITATYNLNGSGVEKYGAWKLKVQDNASGDVGYIDSWTITFN